MRQALIEELRDAKLPDEARDRLVKTIDGMKAVEIRTRKDTDTFSKSVAQYLRGVLIPNYRRNVKNVELQKTLEEAMYNDSFVFHAKLKGALK